jgi:hypothetical protein
MPLSAWKQMFMEAQGGFNMYVRMDHHNAKTVMLVLQRNGHWDEKRVRQGDRERV